MADAQTHDGPDPLDVQLGARIRLLRKQRGMSQAVLAERMGISAQQLQKYERGQNRVAASTLIRIARLLDTTASEFLQFGDGEGGPVDWSILDRSSSELAAAYVLLSAADRFAVLSLARQLAQKSDRVE